MTSGPARQARARWFLVAASGLVIGSMAARWPGGLALVVPATMAILALCLTVPRLTKSDSGPIRHRILWWTMVSFGCHLVAGLIITNTALVHYLGGDALGYDSGGLALARHWSQGLPAPRFPSGKEGFYYVVGALYWVFGPYTAAGLVFNAALSAALVPLLHDITRRLFGASAGWFAPPLALALPGLFIWTSQFLKEAGMIFLVVLTLWCAVRLTERLSIGPLLGIGFALPIAFTFRAWVALMLAAGIIAGIAMGRREIISGLGTGLGALVILSVLILAFGVGYSGYKVASNEDLKRANLVRQDSSTSASGFSGTVDISTPARALSYLPTGVVSFVLGPFPWQIRGLRQLPAAVDVAVWWMLLPSFWRGHQAAWRLIGRQTLLLLVPTGAMVALLALSVSNYGTLVRERAQVIVLVLPLIAFGLSIVRPGARELDRDDGAVVDDDIHPALGTGAAIV